jgi:hypothetical protein
MNNFLAVLIPHRSKLSVHGTNRRYVLCTGNQRVEKRLGKGEKNEEIEKIICSDFITGDGVGDVDDCTGGRG